VALDGDIHPVHALAATDVHSSEAKDAVQKALIPGSGQFAQVLNRHAVSAESAEPFARPG
jgi:hypothetical protein